MNTIASSMRAGDWGSLLVLSILWGCSFFFIELAIVELPPLTIVLVRVALAAVILWLIVLSMGLTVPRSITIWRSFAVMGLINNLLPFSLIVWGQIHITSGLASILNATTPIFTVLVAGVMLHDEKVTVNKLIGVVLGFLGTVVMIGPAALSGMDSHVLAQLAILAAAVLYAFATVFGRRFRKMGVSPMVAAAGQVTASTIFLLPVVLIVEAPQIEVFPSLSVVSALVALAVLSTALAYVLYFRILASAGATNVLLVAFLIPITAILLGVGVLGETLNSEQIQGMGMVALGLLAIDGRLMKLNRGGRPANTEDS